MTFLFAGILLVANAGVLALNCRQPRDVGENCDGDGGQKRLLFYFDTRTDVCQPLLFRGCGGNENRFETRDECMSRCKGNAGIGHDENKPKTVVSACGIATDAKVADLALSCSSGCPTDFECRDDFCCPTKRHICMMPIASGSERVALKHYGRYGYQPGLNNCIRFSYFGDGGNFNNFRTFAECRKTCVDQK